MKTLYYNIGIKTVLGAVLLFAAAAATAQPMAVQHMTVKDGEAFGVTVSDAVMKRNADLMQVEMTLDFEGFKLRGDKAAVFTPVLVNGADSLELDPVGLYKRIRYIQYLRYGREALGGENETSFKYKKRPDAMTYYQTVPYSAWMNGAELVLRRCDYGCCHTMLAEAAAPLAGWQEIAFTPSYHYVNPVAETIKMRELSGRAYIDFPVNRTEIHSDYRNNRTELAKIVGTIDSVRNDKDITVRRITIKGFASPEGTYTNNTRLAKGRTEALKQYVRNLYRFDNNFIATDYEPEDWAGLREFVAGSNLEHRAEILDIIDDKTLEPDTKDWRIKLRFPDDYKFLLETVYPALRHSDYTIEYTIRQFSDVEEIRRTMAEAPQKLSLNEMYVLAQSLEPGSEEYNEVFETAVRLYPSDPTANLNAANAAMQRNDLSGAGRYLAKAGEGAEVDYARAVLATLKGDYHAAYGLLGEAERGGVKDTSELRGYLESVLTK